MPNTIQYLRHKREIIQNGRFFTVEFEFREVGADKFGRTYESESQGGNRVRPTLLSIFEYWDSSRPAGHTIYEAIYTGRGKNAAITVAVGVSRAFLEEVVKTIEWQCHEDEEAEFGPEPDIEGE